MEAYPITQQLRGERKHEQSNEHSARPPWANPSMYLLLSELMLWLSSTTERSAKKRAVRKAILMGRWMQLSGDVLPPPFPGVMVL